MSLPEYLAKFPRCTTSIFPGDSLSDRTFAQLKYQQPLGNNDIAKPMFNYIKGAIKSIAKQLYDIGQEGNDKHIACVLFETDSDINKLNDQVLKRLLGMVMPPGMTITAEHALGWIYESFGDLNSTRSSWMQLTIDCKRGFISDHKELRDTVVGFFSGMIEEKVSISGHNLRHFTSAVEHACAVCPTFYLLEKFDTDLTDAEINQIVKYYGIGNIKSLNDVYYWDRFENGKSLIDHVNLDSGNQTISKSSGPISMDAKVVKHYLFEGITSSIDS